MGPPEWQRVKSILGKALQLQPGKRAEFLDEACGDDPGLRAEVESLLEADHRREAFLASTVGLERDAEAAPLSVRSVPGFKIIRELGAGAMGTVYEAHDEKMNRRVALKLLSRHLGTAESGALRFEKEAWIAGKLDHPHIVKVFNRGEWEELSFYSMEFIDGGSLHDVIQNLKEHGHDERWGLELGNREYIRWVVTQVISVARGLEYAHRHGVVHRDIKPMNLLMSQEHRAVKIADFGLAIEVDATKMTATGTILGTVPYMAPEQILGKRDELDARTDVYALGVTLFQLLTLKFPYKGETPQAYMNAALSSEPRRPRNLNRQLGRDLDAVILKALEKQRGDRYPSAEAFAEDLENVFNGRPIRARPPGPAKRLGRWVRRKPLHAALAATLIIGVPTTGALVRREMGRRAIDREAQADSLAREAEWLKQRGRCSQVLDRVDRLLRLEPQRSEGLTLRALCLAIQARDASDAAEASRLGDAALASVAVALQANPERPWPHYVKAKVLRQLGRTDQAESEEALADRYRDEVNSLEDLYIVATLAMDEGRFEDALRLYTELVTRSPGDSYAVANRGTALDYLERFDEAIIEYRLAISMNPELDLTHVDLARLTNQRGDLDDALRYVERALELNPDGALAWETYSDVLLAHGLTAAEAERFDEAIAYYDKGADAARTSIELDPGVIFAPVNLGACLLEKNRLLDTPDPELVREATSAFETMLTRWTFPPGEEEGEDHLAYVFVIANLCDTLIQGGQLQRAVDACLHVTEVAPSQPVGFYNLAGVYALLGRSDEAFEALRRDHELGDNDWEYLQDDPDSWFDSIRDDPRFAAIIESMKIAAGDDES